MKKLLFAAFLIVSCNASVPNDVLPPSRMQAVLWDMMQADEMVGYFAESNPSLNGLSQHVDQYRQVFSIHKISKENFLKSLNYYEAHPERLQPILDSLYNYADRLQKADTIRHTEPVIDTIKRKKVFVPV